MPLTEITIRQAKPTERPRKLFDGGGLYLLITPQGCKYWRYRYRFAGKDRTLSLGAYREVSLKQARQLHREAKSLLYQGIDPLTRQQKQRQGNAGLAAFECIAREWYEYQRPAWKNAKHAQQVIHTLGSTLSRASRQRAINLRQQKPVNHPVIAKQECR